MEINMSIIKPITLTLLLPLSICLDVAAQSINLVCQHNNSKDTLVKAIDFKKNKQGIWEMAWDGKNVNFVKLGDSPSKGTLKKLDISDVTISYTFEYFSYANQSGSEWGQARIGTISRVDGSWMELLVGHGEALGVPLEKLIKLDGKCGPRGVNKF